MSEREKQKTKIKITTPSLPPLLTVVVIFFFPSEALTRQKLCAACCECDSGKSKKRERGVRGFKVEGRESALAKEFRLLFFKLSPFFAPFH